MEYLGPAFLVCVMGLAVKFVIDLRGLARKRPPTSSQWMEP